MIEYLIETLVVGSVELVSSLLKACIYITLGLVYIILAPIDAIILEYLPDLSLAFSSVGNYLSIISDGLGWAISASGLSGATITLIVAYYTFKLTAPVLLYMLKLALSWYDKLMG